MLTPQRKALMYTNIHIFCTRLRDFNDQCGEESYGAHFIGHRETVAYGRNKL